MPGQAFNNALAKELPVLFVNIGWAIHYDGSEAIIGNHNYLRENPGSLAWESKAFDRDRDGYFECGIGSGEVPEKFHVVFVARDPANRRLRLVGLYAAASASINKDGWAFAQSRLAKRIDLQKRPLIDKWPGNQGMRRWARRDQGTAHKALLRQFDDVAAKLSERPGLPSNLSPAQDDSALEGALQKILVRHRRRESKLRYQKIAHAIHKEGRLVCEVPKCGFDFQKQYGELGAGFAEVHHLKPLQHAPPKGHKTALSDLAVVCANCHRMIHLNGECRKLNSLIRPS